MVTTQSFRLIGKRKPDFKDIICGQIDGENVVFWEDIEQVFPGVKYITNGNTVISMMRDSNRKRITPQCIKYYPGIVLGVVLSTTVNDSPLEPPVGAPAVSRTEGIWILKLCRGWSLHLHRGFKHDLEPHPTDTS
ncbi:MAG: hypothetical protein J3Q66DRAFT_388039 [Benniella sp.]|nr:MAG: hypothetical protein J3Q66DRAFT_388039 [Benniella sp.]